MRKVSVIALVVMAGVFLASSVMAQSAVRDECVVLSKDAAKFINDKGVDAAIAEIGNKEGKFVTKNTYVFLMDLEGNELAHPYHAMTGSPFSAVTASGRNVLKLYDFKDTTGKLFVQEYIKVAKTKGEGWVEYMYPTPEELKKPIPFKEKKSSKKISFVYRIPGKDLMVIAGFFEIAESATKEECIAKCEEAAQLITEKGMDAAFQRLQKKDGKFVWKDSYVYVMDFTGTHLTHPLRPDSVGKNFLEAKLPDGRYLVKELIEIAKTKGEGWIEYMYPKPEELAKPKPWKLSKKLAYVYRIPGKELFVSAGVFE